MACYRGHAHALNCVRACVRLLFEGGYYFFRRAPKCGYYSRAATNQGRPLFEEIRYLALNLITIANYAYILILFAAVDTQNLPYGCQAEVYVEKRDGSEEVDFIVCVKEGMT